MEETNDIKFLRLAIRAAQEGMDKNHGGPFGAVIVKDGEILATACNSVTSSNDPTAHAEVSAIRIACEKLQDFQLTGCTIYASCEPCPMCLGAIYWARPDRLVFACGRKDAASIDFDDDFLYHEISIPIEERKIPTVQLLREEGKQVFEAWLEKTDKVEY
ncbi:MAG: nucleoside deaminase [Saprospiraceae bacterium]|nr:nucleoside deaminase [Saprospiraceae bacterium]